jgi:hypothetical protein
MSIEHMPYLNNMRIHWKYVYSLGSVIKFSLTIQFISKSFGVCCAARQTQQLRRQPHEWRKPKAFQKESSVHPSLLR